MKTMKRSDQLSFQHVAKRIGNVGPMESDVCGYVEPGYLLLSNLEQRSEHGESGPTLYADLADLGAKVQRAAKALGGEAAGIRHAMNKPDALVMQDPDKPEFDPAPFGPLKFYSLPPGDWSEFNTVTDAFGKLKGARR